MTTYDPNFLHQSQSLIPAEARMISGCEDYQTSADVKNIAPNFGTESSLPNPSGRAGGACTSILLECLYKNHKSNYGQTTTITFQEVLMELREKLHAGGFSQIPQLTSSRPLEIKETPFHLRGSNNGVCRALLVGINYIGQNGQLSGCHNDVFNMKEYIQKVHGFQEENITVLLDDGQHLHPTREKMIRTLQELVTSSVAGDSVFFHYSGHGGLLEPEGNDFKNKNSEFDETLIPVDYEQAGQIRDFSLFKHFIQPMAAGVTVTCIVDCCHSGSILDLPYSFRATNIGEPPSMVENVGHLSNLAFLFTLAGGILPEGFEGIIENIQNILEVVNLEQYLGAGLLEGGIGLVDELLLHGNVSELREIGQNFIENAADLRERGQNMVENVITDNAPPAVQQAFNRGLGTANRSIDNEEEDNPNGSQGCEDCVMIGCFLQAIMNLLKTLLEDDGNSRLMDDAYDDEDDYDS